jgi:hypothetical protein
MPIFQEKKIVGEGEEEKGRGRRRRRNKKWWGA